MTDTPTREALERTLTDELASALSALQRDAAKVLSPREPSLFGADIALNRYGKADPDPVYRRNEALEKSHAELLKAAQRLSEVSDEIWVCMSNNEGGLLQEAWQAMETAITNAKRLTQGTEA